MATRLFTSALFAGLAAGLIAALLQFTLVEPLILEGEQYETGAKVHFAGAGNDHHADDKEILPHSHAPNAAETDNPENLTARYGLTFFADFIVFVGWGLIMVAGFAVAGNFGHPVSLRGGLLWGGAGFIAVQLAPGIGLPPELPGIAAADLQARQFWWIATALATTGALALLGYGRGTGFVALGLVLLIAPHIIGAPRLDTFTGLAPPELSAEFVARSLAASMAAWLTLGLAAGYFWNRNAESVR